VLAALAPLALPRYRTVYPAPGAPFDLPAFPAFQGGHSGKIAAWRGSIPPDTVRVLASPEILQLHAEGRTGVILGAHLGNFELCRAMSTFEKRVVNAIVFTEHAERFNQLLRDTGGRPCAGGPTFRQPVGTLLPARSVGLV
jgi:predicted LPLAT superfamily acyltransferase